MMFGSGGFGMGGMGMGMFMESVVRLSFMVSAVRVEDGNGS